MPSPASSSSAKSYRRQELRDFLMTRRARVSPTEAGLPDGGARRRTPGLRREEVAVLAGVGASWYQWLEQGRDITVSPQVLDAVGRVLKLSGDERRHLYVLAGLNPPAAESAYDPDYLCDGLKRLIDAWMPLPAHIMDQYWNCITYNEASTLVQGFRPENDDNCLVNFFTDPVYRVRAKRWAEAAPEIVAQYRAAMSERLDDEGFHAVVDKLSGLSEEFRELWERGDVAAGGQMIKEMEHPQVGTLYLEVTQLKVPARPDLTIAVHNAVPETDTMAKLLRLTSPEGRREAMHAVAAQAAS
ncbi:helix-turn-helix domain-containing protein [Streptomyces sp. A7024]|uniref:Helix-turn-helix domain-containing protein n=1 Tax=Streptomyces coryli TaxID=1128680 RepID=A0A6G4U0R4_9ACTN|nr:helix-turn-helix transcriptional regulator [Streptomyces coryli]NGN65825.1 helix-turn-helix domain-containing protein [Streptomyces coryli]